MPLSSSQWSEVELGPTQVFWDLSPLAAFTFSPLDVKSLDVCPGSVRVAWQRQKSCSCVSKSLAVGTPAAPPLPVVS